jgi:hypothetical protein
MGFIEETGAAQFLRDVRVTAIYEGTNGIQAMDLVGRKLMDGGEAVFSLLDEVESFAESVRADLPDLAKAVWNACEDLRETTEALVAREMSERFAGAVPYLLGFARVLGADAHLRAACAERGGSVERLARFYITRMLPEVSAYLAAAREDALLPAEDFAA